MRGPVPHHLVEERTADVVEMAELIDRESEAILIVSDGGERLTRHGGTFSVPTPLRVPQLRLLSPAIASLCIQFYKNAGVKKRPFTSGKVVL